ERNHGGKIERSDSGAHPERLADGVAIDAAGDVLEAFTHEQRWDAAGELDHLDASANVASRFSQRLAMLARVTPNEIIEMFFEQRLETKENAGSFGWRRFRPARESLGGALDGGIDLRGAAHRGLGDHFARRRIMDRAGGR